MTITKSGALASFYTVNKAPIKHLRVYFSPKQAGSGTASPENVREIEGWNSINFSHSQKGLAEFGSVGPYNYYFNGYNAQWIKTPQQVVPVTDRNQYYTYSCYIDNTNGTATSQVQVQFKDITNTKYLHVTPGNGIAVGTAGRSVVTFKPSSNDYYLGFGISLKEGAIASDGMLEIGNTMTDYEPYKGSLQTIDWSNDIGTIYGGYVDLITGELVQEYGYIEANWGDFTLDKANFADVERRGYSLQGLLPPAGAQNRQQLSNLAVYQYGYQDNVVHIYVAINNIGYVFLPPNTSDDTHIQITYKLATPIIHQLSPQSLVTFIGRNNIWSNADRIEVEYDLAESNDELYRRRNILLQGAPHLETATGNIANFKTDLIAPIKEAKVYFEPKQLGSGDPSPSNVREIVGQNTVEISQTGTNLINLEELPSSYSKTDLTCIVDNNTISLTANLNQSTFGQYTAMWYLPPALLGEEVYIGCTEVVHPESEYFSTVVCKFRDSNNVFISDPTVITTRTNVLGRKMQIPTNAERVEFYFRIAQNGKTVGIPQGDTVVYKNFYVRWPAGTGGYEAYNGQTIPITFPTVGKNLLDPNCDMLKASAYTVSGDIITQTGSDGRGWTNNQITPIYLDAGTYALSCSDGQTLNVANSLDSYETITRLTNGGGTITLNQACYVKIKHTSSTYPTSFTLQIERGSSITAYEPYTTTIYGGYVDLISGEIVQTHFLFQRRVGDMDNNESYPGWKNCSDFKAIANYIDKTDNGYGYNLICNVGDRIWYNSKGTNPTVFIYLDMKYGMTQTEWKTNYPDLVMKWFLPLAVPIHYPLTPQTLKTLKGTNNIWSSANGPVSIKYWTH